MNIRTSLAVATALLFSAGMIHAAEPSEASLLAQTKISKSAAEKIALAKVPSGTVKSAELEQEHGALVWSFDIATPKSANIHEILVNAKTGKIVYTELETPKAQAKEAKADQEASATTEKATEPSEASLLAQTKVSKSAAEKIALAKVPSGTVQSGELEREFGALVWSFDIATPGSRNIHEILVNAKTGSIVHAGIETPKAQAEENAADKMEAKKH